MPLKQIEAEALQLPPTELDVLIASLRAQRGTSSEDTPEAVAAAWDEELARRVDAMERGDVAWIDGDEALAQLRAIASGTR
jgi:hypothetical protein